MLRLPVGNIPPRFPAFSDGEKGTGGKKYTPSKVILGKSDQGDQSSVQMNHIGTAAIELHMDTN